MINVEFIGGPADGKVMTVDHVASRFYIPIMENMSASYSFRHDVPVSAAMKQAVYEVFTKKIMVGSERISKHSYLFRGTK